MSEDVSERRWEESGGCHALAWGGRRWTLEFDAAEPGLRSNGNDSSASLLCLYGLAAAGRSESAVFSRSALVTLERYRNRVQATYAPEGWGGLTVRAAWSPSCGATGVDLEVQASATSVGILRDVEVMVRSQWRCHAIDVTPPIAIRTVQPRDTRSAALSYDGRESPESLFGLTTLPPRRIAEPFVFQPPGEAADVSYAEMVAPNDVARQIHCGDLGVVTVASGRRRLVQCYGLFGHDFEKGVVFRARLRACWFDSSVDLRNIQVLYEQFLDEPPPLGP